MKRKTKRRLAIFLETNSPKYKRNFVFFESQFSQFFKKEQNCEKCDVGEDPSIAPHRCDVAP